MFGKHLRRGGQLTGFRNFQLLTLPNASSLFPLFLGRANKGALGEAVPVLGVSLAPLTLFASLGAAGGRVGRVADPLHTVEKHEGVVVDELEAFQTEASRADGDCTVSSTAQLEETRFPQDPKHYLNSVLKLTRRCSALRQN